MVKITFKPTNEETFEENFDLATTKSVQDIKNRVAQRLNVSNDKIKFIHKGKILKDDQLLQTLNFGDTETFHIVIKKDEQAFNASNPQTGTGNTQPQQNFGGFPAGLGGLGGLGGMGGMGGAGGMGGMGGMGGLGGMNPSDISNMMSNLSPEMIQQMVSSNPMLQNIANSNPQVKAILSNPQMLQQMLSP